MRILLVEDTPQVAEVTTRLLNALGHDVQTCNAGFDALAVLNQRPEPDVVMVDFQLPDMSALDLLSFANIPDHVGVIVYTGGDELESVVRNCSRRVIGLPKPFSIAQLTTAITRAVPRTIVVESFSRAACV